MSNINATNLRKNLFDSLDQVIQYNEPLTVSTKKGNAVILSEEDYHSILETIYLISNPDFMKDLKQSKRESRKTYTRYAKGEKW